MNSSVVNNRYQIIQQIGSGGFGDTFLGEDLGFPHRPRCVIKRLRTQSGNGPAALAGELFQQEAETLYRLGRHPNIPSLIAHFCDRGQYFLVQEFIDGHTLDREFLGGKRYDQHEAIQMLGQLLEILSFVHGEQVIHRDVKPANIIRRSTDASLALIDFGAVKQLNAADAAGNAAVGSHGYMPVEQLAGVPCFSSDLFALGLVVIEGITGLKPLDLPKDPQTLEFQWAARTALLPEFAAFISKLVRRDARDRFPTAREALTALNSIAERSGFFQGHRSFKLSAGGSAPVVAVPAEIPPTVIVSPGQRLVRHVETATPTRPAEPGNARLAKIAIGFGSLAVLFAAFHFAGVGTDRPSPPLPVVKAATETPIAVSKIDVFEEAMTQAREASSKEPSASTEFEWTEISNKYRRAYLLLSSVSREHPNYETAQKSIDFYKQESERARLTAARISAKPQ